MILPFRGSRGITLILISGLLSLLILLSLTFISQARIDTGMTETRSRSIHARLAAEGGLEYAAARLFESADRFPGKPRLGEPSWSSTARAPDAANRGGDWHYRAYDQDDGRLVDAAGPLPVEWLDPLLASTSSPSYARGEFWKDGNGNGVYDPGERWDDTDKDGVLDVWSGRVRGQSPEGGRFKLRIEPGTGCKLWLNDSLAPLSSLSLLLDRLGAVLGVSRFAAPTVGPAILWSDLAKRIRDIREAAGEPFSSLESLRAALGENDFRSIRRFVTTHRPLTYTDVSLVNLAAGSDSPGGEQQVLDTSWVLDINAAPSRLLEAFMRYRMASGGGNQDPAGFKDYPDRPGTGAGIDASDIGGFDPHTTLPAWKYPNLFILHPNQGSSIGRDITDRSRLTGGYQSWTELYHYLDGRKQAWFPSYQTDPLDPGRACPYFAEAGQNMKVDAAFAILKGNGFAPLPQALPCPPALSTYDIDRFVHWSGDSGYYPGPGRQRRSIALANAPSWVLPPPVGGYIGDSPFNGYDVDDLLFAHVGVLGLPTHFDIRSESAGPASAGEAEASLQVGERLALNTQEDFCAPWRAGETRLTRRGITVTGNPDYTARAESGGSWDIPANRSVVTTPMFPPAHYDPSGIMGACPGCISPARKLHLSDRAIPFPLGTGPDTESLDHLQIQVNGRLCPPASYNGAFPPRAVPRTEGDLMAVLRASSPFMASNHNHVFLQFPDPDGGDPVPFPRLPLDSYGVPPTPYLTFAGDPLFGDPGYTLPPETFHAVKSLGISFTCTAVKDNPAGDATFLRLHTPGNGPLLPETGGSNVGCYMDLKIGQKNGTWWISTLNGPLFDEAGDSWGWGGDTSHTRKFIGAFKPGGIAVSTSPTSAAHEDSEIHHVTLYYWTFEIPGGANDDNQYPPDSGALGLWVDGQQVIRQSLLWDGTPDVPFDHDGDPSTPSLQKPRAEMFFLNQPVPAALAPSGLGDRRRFLLLDTRNCTDVAFFTPNTGTSNEAFHQGYRQDFFDRGAGGVPRYRSPRYEFPEEVKITRIDWSGVIPKEIADLTGGDALDLNLRLHEAAGSTVPVSLEWAPGTFAQPVGKSPAAGPVQAFDFTVAFDCVGFPTYLQDAPGVNEILVSYKNRIVWR